MNWIGSKLKKLTDAVKFQLGDPRCFNCPKPGVAMLYDNTQYIVCDNQWCHVAASQKYQHELSKKKCKLQGCNQQCYVENNGVVYDFCSKSHAQEYQKKSQNHKQQQQYYQHHYQHHHQHHYQQQPHYPKQQHQHHGYEKICKLPECTKACYSEHGQTYDFCGKSHAEMYKAQHAQRNQPYYALHGQQQRGNEVYYNSQHQGVHPNEIHFYNRDERYYEFTNFASFPVIIDNKQWPTTEHYFQAQKFVGTPYEEAIRRLLFPREAFDFSRKPEVTYWRRTDWEKVKDDVMYKALLAKFTQHAELFHLLLGTENCKLVEHTRNDSYWGDGGDGTGKNRLGELLMKVRQTLRISNVISLPPPQSPKLDYEKMQSNSPPSPHCDKNPDELILMDVDSTPDNPAAASSKGPEIPMVNPQDMVVDDLLSMSKESSFNTNTQHHTSPSTVVLQPNMPFANRMSVTMSSTVAYSSPSFTPAFTQFNMPITSNTSDIMSTTVGSTSLVVTTSSMASNACICVTQPKVSVTTSTARCLVGTAGPSTTTTTVNTYAQVLALGANQPSLVSKVTQPTSASSCGGMQYQRDNTNEKMQT